MRWTIEAIGARTDWVKQSPVSEIGCEKKEEGRGRVRRQATCESPLCEIELSYASFALPLAAMQ
jgi:hypothetical protein